MKLKNFFLFAIFSGMFFNCQEQSSVNRDPYNNDKVILSVRKQPILHERPETGIVTLAVPASVFQGKNVCVRKIRIKLGKSSAFQNLSSVKIYLPEETDPVNRRLFGSQDSPGLNISIKGDLPLTSEANKFVVSFNPADNIDLTGKLTIEKVRIFLSIGNHIDSEPSSVDCTLRFGLILRAAGQDECDTYRIPGLVTTNSGTLIAVYDNRYNRSKDLQENIDIGMSRSPDGGQTWEPMKVIMDMDEYGGRPEQLNGTGDPCILYDHNTNTLWVAALWMSGASPEQMIWNVSKPGMEPEVTGQFLLVKSTDDGVTWSEPENITCQIKDPSWQLLLQGPGRGITMTDGTLVFPAQFKTDIGKPALDGGQYTCHSTIVYSRDKGKTWHIGKGAKPNTTEAQVVELTDGTLMLNMRDDRNRVDKSETNGRAVSITPDLGLTWVNHPSSNSALPEPNCMASLIAADLNISGEKKKVLFFSNPNNRTSRSNMTIKASLDEGLTWPNEYQLEIYEPKGYGYSCLTMVDERTIGILYEASGELYFQKIPVCDVLKGMQ